jgi:hypothetical protein
MLIDVAILGDRNVIQKEAEKILKYKNLTIEIQRMWNAKTKVIPVKLERQEPFQNHSENTRAPYQETMKRTTENCHIGHCTHTSEMLM